MADGPIFRILFSVINCEAVQQNNRHGFRVLGKIIGTATETERSKSFKAKPRNRLQNRGPQGRMANGKWESVILSRFAIPDPSRWDELVAVHVNRPFDRVKKKNI